MFVMTVKIQLHNVQGQEKVFTLVKHHVKIHTVELDKISEPKVDYFNKTCIQQMKPHWRFELAHTSNAVKWS